MTEFSWRAAQRLLIAVVVAALSVLATGCSKDNAEPSGNAEPSLTRPCDTKTLRLHGSFQGSLGSQFGAVTISTTGEQPCQLRGGRPKVVVHVAGTPVPLVQTHSKGVQLSDGPQVIAIPVVARRNGPGFAFEWQETCLPKGPISVRIQFPGINRTLRVAHEDQIVGPRCDARSQVKPTVFVSLLGRDLAKLIVN